MEVFREALEFCSLMPIQTRGSKFTWANNRRGRNFTKERLDRALVNLSWQEISRDSWCSVEPAVKLDHSPLALSIKKQGSHGYPEGKCFRFETAWILKENCAQTIKEAWGKATSGQDMTTMMKSRLLNCRFALKTWNAKVNKTTPTEIKVKLGKLREMQDKGRGDHVESVKNLQKDIEQRLAEEEIKWKQRAKQHWLQVGDKNTKYFHMQATHRRKVNRISQILDSSNRLVTEKQQIGTTLSNHFSDLSQHPTPLILMNA
ncbi:uncharacterized protein LOC122304621 [Carya illinoinensis]|uniref:uncharacterized protein LOC122304621 n=1 Tax=Carya illinoinensis TaxID=32201 RepID=UPI001C728A47|nr:uncharacterized protein LOC122304621 [Carya illinoinensis]